MQNEQLVKEKRDKFVRRAYGILRNIYSPNSNLTDKQREHLKDVFYNEVLPGYSECLPRMVLSKCPYCQKTLRRVIDPYGLDGPWWWASGICKIAEPPCCEHFRVLLGALNLHGRKPIEVRDEEVLPGPEIPFVVPNLLKLHGMIAVISQLTLATGDTAFPIAYFSKKKIPPAHLHQPWCRKEYWCKNEYGDEVWSSANDPYDFDLKTYITRGKLKWIDLAEERMPIHPIGDEECPFLALDGRRLNQIIVKRYVDYFGLPNGEPICPFGD